MFSGSRRARRGWPFFRPAGLIRTGAINGPRTNRNRAEDAAFWRGRPKTARCIYTRSANKPLNPSASAQSSLRRKPVGNTSTAPALFIRAWAIFTNTLPRTGCRQFPPLFACRKGPARIRFFPLGPSLRTRHRWQRSAAGNPSRPSPKRPPKECRRIHERAGFSCRPVQARESRDASLANREGCDGPLLRR